MRCKGEKCFTNDHPKSMNRDDGFVKSPVFGTKLDTADIMGIVRMDGGVKILLHIDRVLSEDDIAALEQAA